MSHQRSPSYSSLEKRPLNQEFYSESKGRSYISPLNASNEREAQSVANHISLDFKNTKDGPRKRPSQDSIQGTLTSNFPFAQRGDPQSQINSESGRGEASLREPEGQSSQFGGHLNEKRGNPFREKSQPPPGSPRRSEQRSQELERLQSLLKDQKIDMKEYIERIGQITRNDRDIRELRVSLEREKEKLRSLESEKKEMMMSLSQLEHGKQSVPQAHEVLSSKEWQIKDLRYKNKHLKHELKGLKRTTDHSGQHLLMTPPPRTQTRVQSGLYESTQSYLNYSPVPFEFGSSQRRGADSGAFDEERHPENKKREFVCQRCAEMDQKIGNYSKRLKGMSQEMDELRNRLMIGVQPNPEIQRTIQLLEETVKALIQENQKLKGEAVNPVYSTPSTKNRQIGGLQSTENPLTQLMNSGSSNFSLEKEESKRREHPNFGLEEQLQRENSMLRGEVHELANKLREFQRRGQEPKDHGEAVGRDPSELIQREINDLKKTIEKLQRANEELEDGRNMLIQKLETLKRTQGGGGAPSEENESLESRYLKLKESDEKGKALFQQAQRALVALKAEYEKAEKENQLLRHTIEKLNQKILGHRPGESFASQTYESQDTTKGLQRFEQPRNSENDSLSEIMRKDKEIKELKGMVEHLKNTQSDNNKIIEILSNKLQSNPNDPHFRQENVEKRHLMGKEDENARLKQEIKNMTYQILSLVGISKESEAERDSMLFKIGLLERNIGEAREDRDNQEKERIKITEKMKELTRENQKLMEMLQEGQKTPEPKYGQIERETKEEFGLRKEPKEEMSRFGFSSSLGLPSFGAKEKEGGEGEEIQRKATWKEKTSILSDLEKRKDESGEEDEEVKSFLTNENNSLKRRLLQLENDLQALKSESQLLRDKLSLKEKDPSQFMRKETKVGSLEEEIAELKHQRDVEAQKARNSEKLLELMKEQLGIEKKNMSPVQKSLAIGFLRNQIKEIEGKPEGHSPYSEFEIGRAPVPEGNLESLWKIGQLNSEIEKMRLERIQIQGNNDFLAKRLSAQSEKAAFLEEELKNAKGENEMLKGNLKMMSLRLPVSDQMMNQAGGSNQEVSGFSFGRPEESRSAHLKEELKESDSPFDEKQASDLQKELRNAREEAENYKIQLASLSVEPVDLKKRQQYSWSNTPQVSEQQLRKLEVEKRNLEEQVASLKGRLEMVQFECQFLKKKSEGHDIPEGSESLERQLNSLKDKNFELQNTIFIQQAEKQELMKKVALLEIEKQSVSNENERNVKRIKELQENLSKNETQHYPGQARYPSQYFSQGSDRFPHQFSSPESNRMAHRIRELEEELEKSKETIHSLQMVTSTRPKGDKSLKESIGVSVDDPQISFGAQSHSPLSKERDGGRDLMEDMRMLGEEVENELKSDLKKEKMKNNELEKKLAQSTADCAHLANKLNIVYQEFESLKQHLPKMQMMVPNEKSKGPKGEGDNEWVKNVEEEVRKIQKEKEQLIEHKKQLETENAKIENGLRQLLSQHESAVEDNRRKDLEISDLRKNNEMIRQSLVGSSSFGPNQEDARRKIIELEMQVSNLKGLEWENNSLKGEKTRLGIRIGELERDLSQLESSKRNLELKEKTTGNKIQRKKDKIQRLKSHGAILTQGLQKKSEECQELQKKHEQIALDHENKREIEKLSNSVKQENENLVDELRKRESELLRLRKTEEDYHDLEASFGKLREECLNLQRVLSQVSNEKEEMKDKLARQEQNETRESIERSHALKAANEEIEKLKNDKAKSTEFLNKSVNELSKLTNIIKQKDEENSRLKQSHFQLQGKLEAIPGLEGRVRNLQFEKEDLVRQLDETKSQVLANSRLLEEMEHQNVEKSRNLSSSQKVEEELRAENASLKEKLKNLCQQIEEMSGPLHELKEKNQKYRKSLSDAKKHKKLGQEAEKRFSAERVAYDTQILQLKQTILEAEVQNEVLRDENSFLKSRSASRTKENEKMNEKIMKNDQLQSSIAQTNQENAELREKLIRVTREKEEIRLELSQKCGVIEGLKKELHELGQVMEKRKGEFANLLHEVQEMKNSGRGRGSNQSNEQNTQLSKELESM